MKKTLTIIKHELKQTLKRKSFIIMTMALPLLLMLGYGIHQAVQQWHEPTEPQEAQIGYVDEAGGFDKYTTQHDITFILYPNEGKAKDALLAGEVEEYFVIPADYLSSGLITRYTAKSELEVPGKIWRSIEDFLLSNLLAEEVRSELLERAKVPMWLLTVGLDESGEVAPSQDEATKYLLPIVFAILFMFALIFSSGSLFDSVTEEKENKVIEIILSSVSSRQLLTGKVVGRGAAGLLQVAVWLTAFKVFTEVASVNIPFLSEVSIPASLLAWAMVYFILGYLLFAALYAGIGSIGSTAKESQGWSVIIAMPGWLPVWFTFLIVENPDGIFPRVLTFIPLTAPTTAMMRLPTNAISAWEIALSLAILAASVVLTMWAAAKVFRVFLLMYGKKPALREIVRYVKET
ncbi:MAG: ABC transporter permease [Dehalococcoidia bacterium]